MSTVDRITNLAKEKGITQAFISSKIGVHRNWLSCVRRDNVKISDERIAIIADILGTTTAYLKGETDDPAPAKEKSPSPTDGLTKFQTTILQLLDHVPEDRQDELASLIESALKMSGLLK